MLFVYDVLYINTFFLHFTSFDVLSNVVSLHGQELPRPYRIILQLKITKNGISVVRRCLCEIHFLVTQV